MGRIRIIEQLDLYSHSRGFQGPPEKPSPVSVPVKNPIHDHGHYLQQPLANYQKLQASHFQQLMQQPTMKQQSSGVWGGQHSKGTGLYQLQQSRQMIHSGRNVGSRPLALSSSSWTPVQLAHQRHQSGSGSRAVFLGKPAGKKECAGTGVFLPRRVGAPTETRKKSACSTVFVPPRVVQALNLNLEEMGAQPQFQSRLNGNLVPESDIALRLGGGNIKSNPKRNFRPQPGMSNEVRLPQEWTY
uniref:Uncharacterized protein MANES_09G099100 n=1 Tax=Rhizophora mucronata TaxID=61149 RepID=A0A2P2JL52_RHIMU